MDCGWRKPENADFYNAPGVHVWLAAMPEDWRPAPGVLSPEEHARAARFIFARDRAHYAFHHSALRLILAGYTGLAPECVPVRHAAGGKPFLAPPHAALRFSLAHAGSVSMCAVAREREVGVDLERLRPMPDALAIARRFFAPSECDALERLDPAHRERAFFACWTRKEAFLKATGEGIATRLDTFAVPLTPALASACRIEERWSVLDLPPLPGYACALAVEGEPPRVNAWQFSFPGR